MRGRRSESDVGVVQQLDGSPRRWRPGAGACLVALVVLLVSFTGAAVASGSITGRQVKDGSLRSIDLRTDRGVTGADVRDGTLSPTKFASLPPGPQGLTGPQGTPGLNGLDNFDYEVLPVDVTRGTAAQMTVPCAAGTVVGGGASSAGVIQIEESRPLPNGSGWTVLVFNADTTDVTAFAWAVCVGAPQ